MAGIEEGLYDYLKNYAGISSLVSSRIYPMVMPDEAVFPNLVYQKISGIRSASHDGHSGLAHPRFQISCWAETYPAAKMLARQVVLALHGYTGLMGTVKCQAAFIDNETDDLDEGTKLFRVIVDVLIWHAEATS